MNRAVDLVPLGTTRYFKKLYKGKTYSSQSTHTRSQRNTSLTIPNHIKNNRYDPFFHPREATTMKKLWIWEYPLAYMVFFVLRKVLCELMPGHYDMDREMPDETCNLDSASILDDNTAVMNKIESVLLLYATIRYPI
jgi:hypothetical protein